MYPPLPPRFMHTYCTSYSDSCCTYMPFSRSLWICYSTGMAVARAIVFPMRILLTAVMDDRLPPVFPVPHFPVHLTAMRARHPNNIKSAAMTPIFHTRPDTLGTPHFFQSLPAQQWWVCFTICYPTTSSTILRLTLHFKVIQNIGTANGR